MCVQDVQLGGLRALEARSGASESGIAKCVVKLCSVCESSSEPEPWCLNMRNGTFKSAVLNFGPQLFGSK